MSEAKFTKGEWHSEIYSSGKQAYVWAADGTGILANQSIAGNDDRVAEHHANAHLIAAAPEMYGMLEAALSEMHSLIDEVNDQLASRITGQTETEPDYHDQETLYLIQKLLAKARGEV